MIFVGIGVGPSPTVVPLLTYAVHFKSVQHPYWPVLTLTTQMLPVSQMRPLEQHSPPTGAQPPKAQHF